MQERLSRTFPETVKFKQKSQERCLDTINKHDWKPKEERTLTEEPGMGAGV